MCTTYGYKCQYSKDEGPTASFVDHRTVDTISAGPKPTKSAVQSTSTAAEDDIEESPRSSSPAIDQGILDPLKARYVGLHSAVAFPRMLGGQFQSANPPSLHSFAWNCGIRPEEVPDARINLRDLVSLEEFDRFAAIYFYTVHPLFGVLDQQQFLQNSETFWTSAYRPSAFEAVMAGVVALGSFFSAALAHPREAQIVHLVKGVLEDPASNRLPSVDQVSAWVLRTLYLRATTRPSVAWMASCLTMHMAEATGLHHEIDMVMLTTGQRPPIGRDQHGCEQARKLFWCAWSINQIISYDYARSSVLLPDVSCKKPKPTEGDFTTLIIECAQLVPSCWNSGPSTQKTELHKALSSLNRIPDKHPFVTLTRADLCFSFYRRLRLLKEGVEKKFIVQIIEIGNLALSAAMELAQQGHFWWNVTSSVFQYVCVLLAIDTTDSLSNVSSAMATLEKISQMLGTHIALEAVTTAKVLLRDSTMKKKQEVALLEAADSENNMIQAETAIGIDWDALLDPFMTQDFSVY
jgi:hypothetical protein